MAYIETGNRYPGIIGLIWYKPATGRAISRFADEILRGKSGLTPGERELIATHVSGLNGCHFCHDAHGAAAAFHLSDPSLVAGIDNDFEAANITPKLKALLRIATKVQQSGRKVQPSDIDDARRSGASDEDIHDAVIVSAAFCMFNRYVDGLGMPTTEQSRYREMGGRLAKWGYSFPPRFIGWLVRKVLDRKFT